MIYESTITGVTSKVVNRKSDGKAITIFTVRDATNREWTTSRRDLAGEANRLINMPVRLQGREEQNGTFTNTYLEEIEGLNGHAATATPLPPDPTPNYHPQGRPGTEAPVASEIVAEGAGTQKDLSIWRQTACKVAARMSTDVIEFKRNVEELMHFFQTGQWGAGFSREAPPSHVTRGNQFVPEVAYKDPGPEVKPPLVDDDIPF